MALLVSACQHTLGPLERSQVIAVAAKEVQRRGFRVSNPDATTITDIGTEWVVQFDPPTPNEVGGAIDVRVSKSGRRVTGFVVGQ